MPKRKSRPSPARDGKDYEVGYGKPPLHSRFQPGQSGNPAGRRKGLRNLKTDVQRALSAPVKISERGRQRTRSTQEAMILVACQKALYGDIRALDLLVKLAAQYNSEAAEPASGQSLAADDQAILDAFVASRTSAPDAAATINSPDSPDDPAPKSDTDSDDKARK